MSDPLHIVCPHCTATNRVPPERAGDKPKCGKCHKPLFDGQPVELNEAGFERHIAVNDVPLVVDFWAPWCGPCLMMAPEYEKAAVMLEPSARFAKVNTGKSARPRAALRYPQHSHHGLVSRRPRDCTPVRCDGRGANCGLGAGQRLKVKSEG